MCLLICRLAWLCLRSCAGCAHSLTAELVYVLCVAWQLGPEMISMARGDGILVQQHACCGLKKSPSTLLVMCQPFVTCTASSLRVAVEMPFIDCYRLLLLVAAGVLLPKCALLHSYHAGKVNLMHCLSCCLSLSKLFVSWYMVAQSVGCSATHAQDNLQH